MSIFLTRDEVAELTGRKIKARQIEHLHSLGLVFWINAHGVPVVPRAAIEGRTDRPPAVRQKVTSPALQAGAYRDADGNWVPPGLRKPKDN